MQFIIYQNDLRKYFTYQGRIIVFSEERDAINFANMFYQNYALPTAMGSAFSDPSLIGQVISASNSWEIQEKTDNISCETITFEELKRK
jgi:hypothetical protein